MRGLSWRGFWLRMLAYLLQRAANRAWRKAAEAERGATPAAVAVTARQPGQPPAHWLARARSAGPPAHWLAQVRRGGTPVRMDVFAPAAVRLADEPTGPAPVAAPKPDRRRRAVRGRAAQATPDGGAAVDDVAATPRAIPRAPRHAVSAPTLPVPPAAGTDEPPANPLAARPAAAYPAGDPASASAPLWAKPTAAPRVPHPTEPLPIATRAERAPVRRAIRLMVRQETRAETVRDAAATAPPAKSPAESVSVASPTRADAPPQAAPRALRPPPQDAILPPSLAVPQAQGADAVALPVTEAALPFFSDAHPPRPDDARWPTWPDTVPPAAATDGASPVRFVRHWPELPPVPQADAVADGWLHAHMTDGRQRIDAEQRGVRY